MEVTVLELIEQHKKLLEKREKAIANVEYPWNSNDTLIEFVEELRDVNDELNDFLETKLIRK